MSTVSLSIIMFWISCGVVVTNCSSSATCQIKPCTVKQYHYSRERDSVENYALCGYSFKNLTVPSHKHCFEHCAWDCRCISFNYLITTSKENCQLNEENKFLKPGALKRRDGHSYHEIGIDYNVKAGTTCTNCNNGCCQGNNFCLNGGACQEICEANRKRFTCKCRPGYTGRFCHNYKAPRSCAEIKKHGGTTDGVYMIDPDGKGAFQIFCNQSKVGEAWAVIQRRMNGSVDFYRGWEDYKRGFGDLGGEFWLGLEKINRLINPTYRQKLRIELEDFTGYSCYVEYDNFTVNGEEHGYRLASLGFYTGSCVDSLNYNLGAAFTTKDKDHDSHSTNCAVDHQGAWWYNACTQTNLNGVYNSTGLPITGIYWYKRHNSIVLLKRAEMNLQLVG
ncbi:microfibril-associated glycoprotein 4-like isoform X2 [Oculina patagonica]